MCIRDSDVLVGEAVTLCGQRLVITLEPGPEREEPPPGLGGEPRCESIVVLVHRCHMPPWSKADWRMIRT